MTTAMVATAIPFVLQIMNISGWILEVGSNVFRQIGTARDSMVTIAKPLTLVDAPDAQPLVVDRRRGRLRPCRLRLLARRQGGGGRGLLPHRAAGREHRPRRPLGRGQVDARQPDAADVRRRRAARSASTGRTSARSPRQSLRRAIGVVGQDTSLLHRSVRENIKYGRPWRHRRRDDRGGEAGERPRGGRGARRSRGAARLRRPRRRARRQALGRPAAAHRAGAGDPQGRADPDPRRGDERARQRGRGGDPGHALPGDGGQDGDRHRPSPLDASPAWTASSCSTAGGSSRRAATPSSSPATASTPASGRGQSGGFLDAAE